MRILVTDSDTRSALAVVRSLGRAGHEVITGGAHFPSLAARSRFSRAFETLGEPARDPDGFLDKLDGVVARRAIQAVIPTTEISTLLVTGHRHRLPATCAVPFASAEAIDRASNKVEVVALARQLGVPVPESVVVTSAADGLAREGSLKWPVVMKPGRSRVRTATGWLSTSVRYAADAAQLRALLAALPAEAFPVLLQERIHGPGVGAFVCMNEGQPVALFAHRRLREKPPSGGVSVLAESAALDAAAREHSIRLLRALDWRGVAMLEFKQDSRDGSLRIMEINARFWGSLQLAITAGVDFPAILARIAAGEDPGPPPDYRAGVRSRWLAGDLDALLLLLRRSREQLDLSATHPGRWRTLRDFLDFFGARYEIEQADDFAPARFEWRRWLLGPR